MFKLSTDIIDKYGKVGVIIVLIAVILLLVFILAKRYFKDRTLKKMETKIKDSIKDINGKLESIIRITYKTKENTDSIEKDNLIARESMKEVIKDIDMVVNNIINMSGGVLSITNRLNDIMNRLEEIVRKINST